MLTSYEQIYENLLPQLMVCDFTDVAKRLGLTYTLDGVIDISFLGRQYNIKKCGAWPIDGCPTDSLILCVLMYYILSKGSGEPKYEFSPLFRLSGLHDGQNSQINSLTNKQLTKTFATNYEAFKEAAIKVGGKPANISRNGCHSWIFTLFPKILAKIDFYEADEEFPADVQVFLDEASTNFMDFECIAFLAGCLVKELTNSSSIASSHKDLNTLSHCGFIQEML